MTSYPVYLMESFSRSGETLLQRSLNAHPSIKVVHDLRQKNSEAEDALFHEIKSRGLREVPAEHPSVKERKFREDTRLVLKNATWIHRFPRDSFVLIRNPFSIALSAKAVDVKLSVKESHLNIVRRWTRGIDQKMLPFIASTDHLTALCLLYTRKLMAVGDGRPVVYYERYVENPERDLRRIVDHLGVPWNDRVLRAHEDYKEGEYGHGRIELWRPIHNKSQAKYKSIPEEVFDQIYALTAPVLSRFGYEVTPEREIVLKKPLDRT